MSSVVDVEGVLDELDSEGVFDIESVVDEVIREGPPRDLRFTFADPNLERRTFESIASGRTSYQDAVKNTFEDLKKQHGEENVVPIFRQGDIVDFRVQGQIPGEQQGITGRFDFGLEGKLAQHRQQSEEELLAQTDVERGGGFAERAQAFTKLTPEGAINFLRERHGPENVKVIESTGQILIPNDDPTPGAKPFKVLDPESISFSLGGLAEAGKDLLADPFGDIMEAAPGAVGGAVAGAAAAKAKLPVGRASVMGGALGDIVGSAQRQATAAALPGEETLSPEERIKLGAVNVAAGLGGEAVGALGGAAVRGVRHGHTKRLTEVLRGGLPKEEAAARLAEAGRLETETGIRPLTPGRAVGTEPGIGAENALSRELQGGAAERVAEAQRQSTADLGKFVDKTFEAISKGPPSRSGGRRAAEAYKRFRSQQLADRSAAGREAYGAAEKASGGALIMPLGEFFRSIDDIIEANTPAATPAARKVISNLTGLRAGLIDSPKVSGESGVALTDLKTFQRIRTQYNDLLRGKGSFVEDLGRANERRLLGQIVDALDRDAAAAIERGGQSSEAMHLLQKANEVWSTHSRAIASTENAVTQQALKMLESENIEKFADKLIGGAFTPEQVGQAMEIFQRAGAQEAAELRGNVLERMFRRTKFVDIERGGELAFLPGAFAGILKKMDNDVKLKHIFAGDPEALTALTRLNKASLAASRLSRGGTTFGKSPTTPLASAGRLIKGNVPVLGTVAGPVLEKLQAVLVPYSDPGILAKALVDPTQRELLLGLVAPPRHTTARGMARFVEHLSALQSRDPLIQAFQQQQQQQEGEEAPQ